MGGESGTAPPQNNPGKDLLKYVQGLSGALPQLSDLEGQYRPKFGELNVADQGQYLNALLGMGGTAGQAAAGQLQSQRTTDYANIAGNTGSVMGILGGIDPSGRQQVSQSATLANQAFARTQGPLSFQEARGADQAAREAFGSRGRINDNASVAAEILGREDVRAAQRQEASQLGQSAFGMGQQYSSPALSLLTGVPASAALGQDYLGASASAIGRNTPQLVDTGAGISLGQQNNANLASWQQNQAAAKQAQNSQYTQLAASALAAVASAYSDKRVKRDIKKVGKTDSGLPVYTYKLAGSPQTQMGVMAQEVEKKKPEALGPKRGGIMTVDYSKL